MLFRLHLFSGKSNHSVTKSRFFPNAHIIGKNVTRYADRLLNMLTDFVHHELFENISSNIHKGFASWTAADVGPLLLLNNRKVYSTDQSKCKAVSNRNKKTINTQARSRLPPTQRELTPAGKPRRHISDSEPSDDDLQSSDSSVSETYKTYGKHTDSELEDGEATQFCLSVCQIPYLLHLAQLYLLVPHLSQLNLTDLPLEGSILRLTQLILERDMLQRIEKSLLKNQGNQERIEKLLKELEDTPHPLQQAQSLHQMKPLLLLNK